MQPMGVEFRVLGPLEAVVDGEPVALGGPKQRALLALLLLHANEVVPAERALDEIWRDAEPGAATRSLQVYVSSLRKALGSSGALLETRPGGYSLTLDEDQLDASRFERLLHKGQRKAESGDAAGAADLYREALGLWRGPALADLAYEDFALAAIDRLEELRLLALEERIDAELTLGHHSELTPQLEALVAEHPLRERLRGQLMLTLYRSGRQADALAAYREAREALDELGLEPTRELKDLETAILRHDASLTVEPAELRARRRLPAPATAFVGRRREVDELTKMLRAETRLVTLTGPGGTGKTRVGIQAAHELADAFPDGVVFVGLAALRDAALVPAQIASALGLEDAARPAPESLAEHLRERTALLLLDNFEQVDAAAPELGALLAAAPGLRLLVTSRHPLRLYGEHEFAVPPLAEDEAVALFVARARAVERGFEASEAVSKLCLLLDRLPLAIELVAARVRERSPHELLRDLPPRLELAVGGPRDTPERHQTLWATIDWSYELLDPQEQALFARLSVFEGGSTLEAAVAVCEADPDRIRSLVDKSLLAATGDRVAMLETVREHALDRLYELGEASALRRRHADHYLSLVLAGKEVRRDPREVEWMDRLEADRENMRAAFSFLLEHEPKRAAQLADGAYRFWYMRAHFEEGFGAFEQVLRFGELLAPLERANALMYCAAFAFGRRELARARELVEEALVWHRTLGELDPIARALVLLGTIRSEEGDHEGGVEALEESVEVARRHGDRIVLNFALSHLVRATVYAGLYARTRELGVEALSSMQDPGDGESRSTVLGNLGLAALGTGAWAEAAERFVGALAIAAERSDPVGTLENIESIAASAAAAGEAHSSARLFGAAEALAEERDIQLEAINVTLREDALARLGATLAEPELREHWDAGRVLTLEAAAEAAAELGAQLGRRA